MAMSSKPLILIIGVTGRMGGDIVDGLLAAGNFRVAGLVRPESLKRPETARLKAAGVDIRPGDIVNDSVEKLASLLQNVDTLISTVVPYGTDQRSIFSAAKKAGVKRVLPSEFGPVIPYGVIPYIDKKYEIRQFIKNLGLNYTFVYLGWWLELLWPYPHSLKPELSEFEQYQNNFYGEGDKPIACTSRKSAGELVAKIISDPRTLNQVVIAYDAELSIGDSWKLAEKISGEDFSDYLRIPADEIRGKIRPDDGLSSVMYNYGYFLNVRGENSVAKAKEQGALDVRDLYPDYRPVTAEEAARQFYREPFRLDIPITATRVFTI